MKVLALVIAFVFASAASSWAVEELPKGQQVTIKCQEGGKVMVFQKNLLIQSFSDGTLVVKPFRGHPFVVLVGSGQCVIWQEERHG